LVDGPVWTLNPEFQCYLLALLCGLLGVFRRPWLWVTLGAVAATIYILHACGISFRIGDGKDLYQDIVRFSMAFIAGGTLRIFSIGRQRNIAVALTCLVVLAVAMFDRRFAEPALAACGGYLMIAIGYARLPFLARFNRLPDASYGTYLYGWPIQKLLLLHLPGLTPLQLFALALPLAWVAGTISWYLVERPALSFR
jgi:peptidoglycan/LPS O-acetylase OafA/YrhL